jgi:hypothetical protein
MHLRGWDPITAPWRDGSFNPDNQRQAGPGFSPSSRILHKPSLRRSVSRTVSWLGDGSRSPRRRSSPRSLRPAPHTPVASSVRDCEPAWLLASPRFSYPSPGDKDLVCGGSEIGDALRSASSEYSLPGKSPSERARANAAMNDPTRVIRDPLISVNPSFLSLISCYPYSPLISICISLLLLASIVPPLH